MPATGGNVLAVDYGIDLSFARQAWPAGNEQGGYTDGKSLYLISKALFLDTPVAGTRKARRCEPGYPGWLCRGANATHGTWGAI